MNCELEIRLGRNFKARPNPTISDPNMARIPLWLANFGLSPTVIFNTSPSPAWTCCMSGFQDFLKRKCAFVQKRKKKKRGSACWRSKPFSLCCESDAEKLRYPPRRRKEGSFVFLITLSNSARRSGKKVGNLMIARAKTVPWFSLSLMFEATQYCLC